MTTFPTNQEASSWEPALRSQGGDGTRPPSVLHSPLSLVEPCTVLSEHSLSSSSYRSLMVSCIKGSRHPVTWKGVQRELETEQFKAYRTTPGGSKLLLWQAGVVRTCVFNSSRFYFLFRIPNHL